MKLVTKLSQFQANRMFRVDINVDTAAVVTNMGMKNIFVISARDEDAAAHEANMIFREMAGINTPQTIGEMITMTMDFAKWAISDFKAKNAIKSERLNDHADVIICQKPEPISYGEAMRLVRKLDATKNFLTSLIEECEVSKVV